MRQLLVTLCLSLGFSWTLGAQTAGASPQGLVVEAYVDGPSTLCLTPTGIYWMNGPHAKPGRHGGKNYPTYINDKEWIPRWGKDGDDRGKDRSDVFSLNLPSLQFDLEVLSISDKKGGQELAKRKHLQLVRRNGELCVDIPDPEVGPKWYRIRLKPSA